MPSRRIEEQLEGLKALRAGGVTSEAEVALKRALRDRVNLVVAKAASVTAEMRLNALQGDLSVAFERFFEKAVETDPQCGAKNALARALVDLGVTESRLFLRGARHVQLEAVWGGREDTATTLRGICTLALVQTTDLPRRELLRHMVRSLADARNVRLDAVRALEQLDGEEAALLLRLKANLGDEYLDVTGQVFDSLLHLEGEEAVDFVGGFLAAAHEGVSEEAALSLGASRLPGAVALLISTWENTKAPEVRDAILRALSASRQAAGLDFLFDLIRSARQRDALMALDALSMHKGQEELRGRIAEAVGTRSEPAIQEAFRAQFPDRARE